MAVVRNSVSRVKTTSNTAAGVMADLNKWVEQIHNRAEEKVEEAVSTITNTTNRQYASNGQEGNISLLGNPIYYKMFSGKSTITGVAIGRPLKEFIYLEFGTRQSPSDSLRIITGWESGIDALSVAAPYKSPSTKFRNKQPIHGRYYFLNNIDIEGMKFIRGFWK
jgi:hypothetical protein